MSESNIFTKLGRVRNFPLLAVRLIGAVLPGGFLTSTAHVRKQILIKELRKTRRLDTFVETGTNEGDMVEAVKSDFTRIYSIELDQRLFQHAHKRFAGQQHITILQGDSAEVLPRILPELSTPSLFWLDAHYSGGTTAKGPTETPIIQEIDSILKHPVKGHLILIDDAWSFGTIKDYPTVSELKGYIRQKNPRAEVTVSRGVIWVSGPGV